MAKARLLRPVWFGKSAGFVARRLRFPELQDTEQNEPPEFPPYERMAKLWHPYIEHRVPNYAAFLAALAKRRGLELRSVLDLGCGSGTLTPSLASIAGEAVGLDASETMLEEARERCTSLSNVEFVHEDFRRFDLGCTFDAVVCASDSLNYVNDLDELGEVFRCVASHLEDGGLFVFDAMTEKGMRAFAGIYHHATLGDQRFAVSFQYSPEHRKQWLIAHLPEGIEIHARIPLNPKDVETAAGAANLVVDDYFSFASIPGRWFVGPRCFYVLRKT